MKQSSIDEGKRNNFEVGDLIIYAMFILITSYSLSILIAVIYGI